MYSCDGVGIKNNVELILIVKGETATWITFVVYCFYFRLKKRLFDIKYLLRNFMLFFVDLVLFRLLVYLFYSLNRKCYKKSGFLLNINKLKKTENHTLREKNTGTLLRNNLIRLRHFRLLFGWKLCHQESD